MNTVSRKSKTISKSKKMSIKRTNRTRKSRGSRARNSRKNNKFFGLF